MAQMRGRRPTVPLTSPQGWPLLSTFQRTSYQPATPPAVKENHPPIDKLDPSVRRRILNQRQKLLNMWIPKTGDNKVRRPPWVNRRMLFHSHASNEGSNFERDVLESQSVADLKSPVHTPSSEGNSQGGASEELKFLSRINSAPTVNTRMSTSEVKLIDRFVRSSELIISSSDQLMSSTLPQIGSSVSSANGNGQRRNSWAAPVQLTEPPSANNLPPRTAGVDSFEKQRRRLRGGQQRESSPAVCQAHGSPAALHANKLDDQPPTTVGRSQSNSRFRVPYASEIFDLFDENKCGFIQVTEWAGFDEMIRKIAPEVAYTVPSNMLSTRKGLIQDQRVSEQEWINYVRRIVASIGPLVWEEKARKVTTTLRARQQA